MKSDGKILYNSPENRHKLSPVKGFSKMDSKIKQKTDSCTPNSNLNNENSPNNKENPNVLMDLINNNNRRGSVSKKPNVISKKPKPVSAFARYWCFAQFDSVFKDTHPEIQILRNMKPIPNPNITQNRYGRFKKIKDKVFEEDMKKKSTNKGSLKRTLNKLIRKNIFDTFVKILIATFFGSFQSVFLKQFVNEIKSKEFNYPLFFLWIVLGCSTTYLNAIYTQHFEQLIDVLGGHISHALKTMMLEKTISAGISFHSSITPGFITRTFLFEIKAIQKYFRVLPIMLALPFNVLYIVIIFNLYLNVPVWPALIVIPIALALLWLIEFGKNTKYLQIWDNIRDTTNLQAEIIPIIESVKLNGLENRFSQKFRTLNLEQKRLSGIYNFMDSLKNLVLNLTPITILICIIFFLPEETELNASVVLSLATLVNTIKAPLGRVGTFLERKLQFERALRTLSMFMLQFRDSNRLEISDHKEDDVNAIISTNPERIDTEAVGLLDSARNRKSELEFGNKIKEFELQDLKFELHEEKDLKSFGKSLRIRSGNSLDSCKYLFIFSK